MRLTWFGALIRTAVLLVPCAIILFFASYIWSHNPPELSATRSGIFRRSLASAWTATAIFVMASADQLKTRELVPGFWTLLNLAAGLLAVLGLAGAFTGKGRSRVLLVIWGSLLFLGMIGVVASTIP